MQVKIDSTDSTRSINHVSIRQFIAQHHQFELRQSLEDRSETFKDLLKRKAEEMLGKKVEIKFGSSNKFVGIVTSLSLGRSGTGGSDLIIRGQSPTFMLDEGAHTASHYDKTLKETVDKTLKNYSGSAVDNKTGYSKKLKYIVQYKEGNFAFLSRLAARFGEWLYYDGEKLYFGKKPSSSPVDLHFGVDINSMDFNLKVVPVNAEIHAYDYKKHDFIKEKTQYNGLNDYAQIAYDKSKNEVFKGEALVPYPQYMSKEDLAHFAKVNSQARTSEMVFLSGSTSFPDLRIASQINVSDQRNELLGGSEEYGTFIVTHLSHQISLHGERYDYNCQFESIPVESETPPMAASFHPPFCEMQLADVTENNDPDAMGRIRVQFLWQRDANEKSPWIRVASPYSGKDKGFYIIPEKGDQVLVAFEGNNPERPFALTGMYNNDAKPEHHNADNHKKALKTAGGHEILMNDEKGKESFGITSPKDVSITAGGKMALSAESDISITNNGGDITISTPGTLKISAKAIEINADTDIKIAGLTIKAEGTTEVGVKGAQIKIEADATLDLKANAAATLEGQASVSVSSTGMTAVKGSVLTLN